MGACGCGDYQGDFKFKGPGNIVYVLQLYQSCDYCGTPAGVIIYAMGPRDQRDWCVDQLPEVEIEDIGTGIGVVDPKVLADELRKQVELDIDGCEPDYHAAFVSAVNKQLKDNERLYRSSQQTGTS